MTRFSGNDRRVEETQQIRNMVLRLALLGSHRQPQHQPSCNRRRQGCLTILAFDTASHHRTKHETAPHSTPNSTEPTTPPTSRAVLRLKTTFFYFLTSITNLPRSGRRELRGRRRCRHGARTGAGGCGFELWGKGKRGQRTRRQLLPTISVRGSVFAPGALFCSTRTLVGSLAQERREGLA